MSSLGFIAAVAATTFGATLVGVELMRRWSLHRLLDHPNERSSHSTPTPRGGGLPLVVAALLVWGVVLELSGGLTWAPHVAVLTGTAAVAVVSWIDDLRTVRFKVRLLVHLGAAALVLWVAPPPTTVRLGDLGLVPLGLLAWPLALIWVAGLANAYNFMDGIDGIAGGQGLVAGLLWACLGLGLGAPLTAALGVTIAAACLAFLLFNWAPARIFMGDVGSATLGYLFAVIPFTWGGAESGNGSPYWVIAAAAVWPFVFDTGFTLVRRWRRGEKITDAHRSHLYQRLVIAGWPHARATSLYMAWAVTTALAGWAMAHALPGSGLGGLGWATLSGLLVWRLTLHAERARA